MNGSVFLSGQARRWEITKQLGVARVCNGVRLRGLANALINGERLCAVLRINDVPQTGWRRERDRVILASPLPRGNYIVSFQIIYTDLDKPVYTRI